MSEVSNECLIECNRFAVFFFMMKFPTEGASNKNSTVIMYYFYILSTSLFTVDRVKSTERIFHAVIKEELSFHDVDSQSDEKLTELRYYL